MTKLEHIEKSVAELSYEEFWAFAAWFNQLPDERWDREMEADAKAGKLDKLIAEALEDHRAARTRPLSGCNLGACPNRSGTQPLYER
jgi:hypothetical protein